MCGLTCLVGQSTNTSSWNKVSSGLESMPENRKPEQGKCDVYPPAVCIFENGDDRVDRNGIDRLGETLRDTAGGSS